MVVMKSVKKLCVVIDTFTDATGRVFSFIVTLTVAAILCEVIMRKCFNRPQIWTSDIILYTFGAYAVLGLAYGLLHKSYVRVDLVVSLLPKVADRIIHLITSLVFMWPFTIWVFYRSISFFWKAYSIGELQYSVWQPPIWPVKMIFCIGILLLNIQAVSETLKEALWIICYYQGGKQVPAEIGSMSLLKAADLGGESKEVGFE